MKAALTLFLSAFFSLSLHASEMDQAINAINNLNNMNNLERAEKVVHSAVKPLRKREKSIVYSTFGWKLISKSEYVRAEHYFRKAGRYNDKSYEVIGLAIALLNQEKYRASIEVLDNMLNKESDPLNIPKRYRESANYVLGVNYYQLNKLNKACLHWGVAYQVRKRKSEKGSYGQKSRQKIKQ
ncbi:MAG TPA: hypothetical protein HPP65_13270 [Gammaproteobacteria bacterium]|jgi:tetratricopeptide (TPR) repeat protein|nr:hypothetical protein [Gammaproteobacteria bacterium]MBT3893553.1 hypothetical protein [Gammaproteobacteria bacterium]MBT4549078.1 hypothetical protein [Gammaproteobacteria bacterium]MBT5371161.1 hypothetical protein [Gammaproteobacteria bacterium]MBT6652772.1 hypothetical protein [Gammaproteobacteria bacterium]